MESVQNSAHFNRDKIFSIRKTQKIDKINYYWLKNLEDNKILIKRFQRAELLPL